MNRRMTIWLILLALAAAVLGGLHPWITAHAWAEWQGGDWRVVAAGWSVLRIVWPVALLGSVPGALIAWYVLDKSATAAVRADHAAQQRRLEAERQWLQDEADHLEEQHRQRNQAYTAKETEAQRLIEAARAK